MSFIHGRKTELWAGGADISAYFRSLGLNFEADNPDTTTFRNDWRTFIPGLGDVTEEAGGLFDAAHVPTWTAILGDLPAMVLTTGPGGLHAALDMARLAIVASATYKESAPVGDVVSFDLGLHATGPLGFGHVLEPLTAVTGDQNGTSRDLTAASSNGFIAHLHVTSVSASDSIVVSIEDSSTGSSGWATVGTFASKSAAGAERIVVAGALKRYVRVVDDVTGAGVSIIRGVALART
jgi:hypothetical protein